MSPAARSLFVFGVYVLIVGAVLIIVPAMAASLLLLPPATVGLVRVVGILSLVIGAYDCTGSRAECLPYIRASVPVRFGFAAGTALLVALGQMPWTLLLLGASDIAGAIWTAVALRTTPVSFRA